MTNWTQATAALRAEIYAKTYKARIAALKRAAVKSGKRTAEQGPTPGMEAKAANAANAEAINKLYLLDEFDGVANPAWSDSEWAPNAPKSGSAEAAPKPAPAKDPEVEALAEWLAKQTWSDFAVSLADQFKSRGSLSPKQLSAARSMKAKMDAKAPKADKPESVVDLSEIPSGYYAVPGGDTRLKVRVAHGKPGSKWDGWTFVSDGADYGSRKNYGTQRPGQNYRGDIAKELAAILADPFEAQARYGQLTGTCGHCGRRLEDEESVARGIGPICLLKWEA